MYVLGLQGDKGSSGLFGEPGAKGEKGDQAIVGPPGPRGKHWEACAFLYILLNYSCVYFCLSPFLSSDHLISTT